MRDIFTDSEQTEYSIFYIKYFIWHYGTMLELAGAAGASSIFVYGR